MSMSEYWPVFLLCSKDCLKGVKKKKFLAADVMVAWRELFSFIFINVITFILDFPGTDASEAQNYFLVNRLVCALSV